MLLKGNILNVRKDAMDAKIASLTRQFAAIPLRDGSVTAPNVTSHRAISFVCNFIAPQIKFAFGVYTPLEF